MEARLLCLENTVQPEADFRKTWVIANGSGTPISQGQVPAAPPPLLIANGATAAVIQDLTAILAKPAFAFAQPGWSNWFVGKRVQA